jgi:hypothetical protein
MKRPFLSAAQYSADPGDGGASGGNGTDNGAAAGDNGAAAGDNGAAAGDNTEDDDIGDDEIGAAAVRPAFLETKKDDDASSQKDLEALRAENERLKVIEAEYNTMKANPLVSAAILHSQGGGSNVKAFLQEVGGAYFDVEKLKPEQIYELHYRAGHAKKYNLSEDQIQNALTEFNGLSEYRKTEIIDPIKEKMESESSQKLKTLADKLNELAGQNEVDRDDFIKKERKYGEEFVQKVESLVGTQKYRVLVTPEMAKEIVEASKVFSIRDPKTFVPDIEATIDNLMWSLYSKKILKRNIEYGVNRGVEKGPIGKSGQDRRTPKSNAAATGLKGDVDEKYQKAIDQNQGKLPRVGSPTPN